MKTKQASRPFGKQVGVRLTSQMFDKLEAIARADKRPVGQLCRIVLEEYIDKRTSVAA
jgi:predicted DNA-binding ribbon-helix-helix protein